MVGPVRRDREWSEVAAALRAASSRWPRQMEVRRTGFAFSALSACLRDTQRGREWMEGSIRLVMSSARVSIVGNPFKDVGPDVWEGVYYGRVHRFGEERAFAKVDASRGYELTLSERLWASCGH